MKDNSVDALIRNITEVVLRTHFYYVMDYDLQKDLMQEGYLKAYELLSSGNYDPYRNLRTFIYTGVRNAMTNYMYHNNKESHTSIEVVNDSSWQNYKKVINDDYYENRIFYYDSDRIDNYIITYEDIKLVCDKYSTFSDYTNDVINYLVKIGIYEGKVNDIQEGKKNEFILEAIKGEILWNLFLKNKLKE